MRVCFKILLRQKKYIHTLSCITTLDSKLQCFQYKILHNTLHLNQKLFFNFTNNTSLLNASPFAKNYAKLYFNAKLFEKGLNRRGKKFLGHFHKKVPSWVNTKCCPKFLEYTLYSIIIITEILPQILCYNVSKSSKVKLQTNYLQENGKQYCKICKTSRKYELSMLIGSP